MPYVPHTKQDIDSMLAAVGADSIEELFNEIPQALRAKPLNPEIIPSGKNEMDIGRMMQELALKDKAGLCFIGAGAYEHHIPAAVWEIASRGEFLTAYTPYQAEASQGTLQLLYEYQSMMTTLMGLDVSNASLYDGASALAEAILMAIRSNKKSKSKRILIPHTVNPSYRKVAKTIVNAQGVEIEEVPYCLETGNTLMESLQQYNNKDITALVIAQPNFFGVLEDIDNLVNWAHSQGALVIAVVNPTAMALLKEPGSWGDNGADLACGEGQPLGVPLASGGPYFGFLCCKQEFVRQMPGRIVGCTVDSEGKRGFSLTLQAREQHIRRSKATSNICTNQGLLVTAATIYMSLLGSAGLYQVAAMSHDNTNRLLEKLCSIKGVERVFNAPFFHEGVIRLNKPSKEVLMQLSSLGIQGGYSLTTDYPELGETLLVCATETKSIEDIEKYYLALQKIMEQSASLSSCEINLENSLC